MRWPSLSVIRLIITKGCGWAVHGGEEEGSEGRRNIKRVAAFALALFPAFPVQV